MRRLIHLVMLLAVLLGGPGLSAWAMPCCAGIPAPASRTPLQATANDTAESVSMQDMPSCHHKVAPGAVAASRCAHDHCILQQQMPAADPQALTLSADVMATPARMETRLEPVVAGEHATRPMTVEPSPPIAMPLPLRV